MLRIVRYVLVAWVAALVPAAAQIDNQPKVHARLIAERDAVNPGGTISVALELNTRKGWHTYWSNPGDAGAPTEIKWMLPQGWRAGPIQWPYPRAEAVGPLMDYGYEGKPWLLVDITAPSDARPGESVAVKATANWLVCAEVCVPEEANLTLPLGVGDPELPPDPAFASARAKLPVRSPWPMRYRAGDGLDLFVESPTLVSARPAKAEFFPSAAGFIKGIAPQAMQFARNGLLLRMERASKFRAGALTGVIELTSADGSVQALEVNALPGEVPDAGGAGPGMGLWLALFFAFAGGLILNLMPCVLPVLAMKALALASHGGGGRDAAREGVAYGAGAVLSFAALGGALIVLRASGNAIGWGYQLQEPIAVGSLALLMFAVGLNLSGVFELPGFGGGDGLTRRGGLGGAFFTGVLAVAVAAPCTAPFMAAALGFALTQPETVALAIFLSLGLGFAAPFVAIGFSPRLLRLIPRPGPWMLWFKQALAFPMYGASVWLVWVLANGAGPNAMVAVLAAMIAFAFGVWVWTASRTAGKRGRGIGAFSTIIALIAALGLLSTLLVPTSAPGLARQQGIGIPHEPYSEARLAQLRKEHRAVFVNATAAWCITCLVNERVAFSSGAVREAFARNHVACLIADWTRRNPEITRLLEAHGRDGVPLYLYYAPGSPDAKILPQILTENDVLKALASR